MWTPQCLEGWQWVCWHRISSESAGEESECQRRGRCCVWGRGRRAVSSHTQCSSEVPGKLLSVPGRDGKGDQGCFISWHCTAFSSSLPGCQNWDVPPGLPLPAWFYLSATPMRYRNLMVILIIPAKFCLRHIRQLDKCWGGTAITVSEKMKNVTEFWGTLLVLFNEISMIVWFWLLRPFQVCKKHSNQERTSLPTKSRSSTQAFTFIARKALFCRAEIRNRQTLFHLFKQRKQTIRGWSLYL